MDSLLTPARARLGLSAILLLAGSIAFAAMLRTSTTFDEVVMIAAGARGYHTGNWKMAPEHPPVAQYLFGLPVSLAGAHFPEDTTSAPELVGYRYRYARVFFGQIGNDPERVAMLGRIPAILCMLGLLALVFFFTRRAAGDAAALLATWLTAFVPDVLAHGGVAYNDVPVTAAIFGAIWALDEAMRQPSWRRGALAGLAIALALGVKNSAIALAPIALGLLALQTLASWRDPRWRRQIVTAALATFAAIYLGLVLIYRGDVMLAEWRYAINFAVLHARESQVPSFLLGERSVTGWWYFFPVAFLFKTSAALHLLVLVGAAGLVLELKRAPRALLTSRLRAPFVALAVLVAMLVTSSLNIGFRYALPVLPLLCILAAAGTVRIWPRMRRAVHMAILAAIVWAPLHVLSYYPWFHGYISEYGPGRDRNYQVLADSSLDWGQSLLALRDYMKSQGIERVYLSYFGSALPESYGIRYLPMLSFFDLPAQPNSKDLTPPTHVAISATNLVGVYLAGDPFQRFRALQPDTVLAYTMYVYRLGE